MKNLTFVLLILMVSCASEPNKKEIYDKVGKLPVLQEKFWNFAKSKKLANKVLRRTPPELIEYLNLMNKADGFSENPKVAVPDDQWIKDIKRAINELPPRISKIINKYVKAIVFVEELGGTAIVPGLKNAKGVETSSVVILDIKALNKKANDWCSWKESSPFSKEEGYKLKCIIAESAQNNRSNAFQYIFLHEMGHVILADKKLDHPWNDFAKSQKDLDKYGFTKLSWKYIGPYKGKINEHVISNYDDNFPERQKITYYMPKPKLKMSEAVATYSNLVNTNFSTLYAASNKNDDVADSVVNYIHTQILKKPFKIKILKNDRVIYTYKDCWQQKRCRAKRNILRKYLGN